MALLGDSSQSGNQTGREPQPKASITGEGNAVSDGLPTTVDPAPTADALVVETEVDDGPDPVKDNEDPTPVKENTDSVPVKDNMDPVPIQDNKDPVQVKDNKDTVQVKDNTDPVPIQDKKDLVQLKDNTDPLLVKDSEDIPPDDVILTSLIFPAVGDLNNRARKIVNFVQRVRNQLEFDSTRVIL